MVRKMTETAVPQIKIDFGTLRNVGDFRLVYHEDEDTLFLRPAKALPGTSVDWNGEVWIRVSLASGEIVGLEIDEFEFVFIKRHPELESAWKEIKPLCLRKPVRCAGPSALILLNFFTRLLQGSPQPASLAPVSP